MYISVLENVAQLIEETAAPYACAKQTDTVRNTETCQALHMLSYKPTYSMSRVIGTSVQVFHRNTQSSPVGADSNKRSCSRQTCHYDAQV